jgi:hypothetical protein
MKKLTINQLIDRTETCLAPAGLNADHPGPWPDLEQGRAVARHARALGKFPALHQSWLQGGCKGVEPKEPAWPVELAAFVDLTWLTVRKVSRTEFLMLLPPLPPGSESWKPEEWAVKEAAWTASLEPAAREDRILQARDFCFRLMALCTLDPPMTELQARHLGDDAAVLTNQVLAFSGIMPKPVEAPAPLALVPPPLPDDVDAAAPSPSHAA